jgi:hypothetical protein
MHSIRADYLEIFLQKPHFLNGKLYSILTLLLADTGKLLFAKQTKVKERRTGDVARDRETIERGGPC